MSADDLLGVLVQGEVDGERLDDTTLVYESLLLLIGGDETSRHVISGGMEALLRRPDQFEELRGNRELVPSAMEEMLRWVTPIKNFNRKATRDVEAGGETIRAGQNVLLLYPSANRDETVFDDPESFDIHRHPNEHVAFGSGRTSASGTAWPGPRSPAWSTGSSTGSPTSAWPARTTSPCGPRISSSGSSRCPWCSPPARRWGMSPSGPTSPPRRPVRRSAGPRRRTR